MLRLRFRLYQVSRRAALDEVTGSHGFTGRY